MRSPALAILLLGLLGLGAPAFARQEEDPKPPPRIIRVPKKKPGAQAEPVQVPADPAAPAVAEAPKAPAPPAAAVVPPGGTTVPATPPTVVAPAPVAPGQPGAPAVTGTPVAAGSVPPVVTDRVMVRRIGSEKFQQMLQQMQQVDPAGARGAPSASVFWDHAARIKEGEPAVQPRGTNFFSGQVQPTTVEGARKTVNQYGSIPGGVVVEGVAAGLGAVDDVWYDSRYNALILNGRSAYFVKVPPASFAVLCRAIAQDEKERVGVSLGEKQIVYGKVPETSDIAWDLKLADHFLADMVFVFRGKNHWTAGYKFAGGYTPERFDGKVASHSAVFFKFNGFRFELDQDEIRLGGANFDVQLIPLSDTPSADGGLLPDPAAIARDDLPKAWHQNARHLAENIGYYGQERLVDRIFSTGEAASILRELKRAGYDLEVLAGQIRGGR